MYGWSATTLAAQCLPERSATVRGVESKLQSIPVAIVKRRDLDTQALQWPPVARDRPDNAVRP